MLTVKTVVVFFLCRLLIFLKRWWYLFHSETEEINILPLIGKKKKRKTITHVCCMLSHLGHVFTTLWTIALQAPLSMRFSSQEYWSVLLCPSPGDLPTQGWCPCLSHLLHCQMDSLPLVPLGKPKTILHFHLTISFFKPFFVASEWVMKLV